VTYPPTGDPTDAPAPIVSPDSDAQTGSGARGRAVPRAPFGTASLPADVGHEVPSPSRRAYHPTLGAPAALPGLFEGASNACRSRSLDGNRVERGGEEPIESLM
jgi:hypothetical protein